ncbi:MAG: glycosyl transferase group 1, partial [Frankiales bacterium]|nr:glycosyl transferase group 1 [Frankiales bacterium]
MERWLIVADSSFLPARGGGEREHLGFVRAVHHKGWLAGLVIPTSEPLSTAEYIEEVGSTPVFAAPRRTSPLSLLHPRYPYVVASRPVQRGLCEQVREAVGPLTGIVVFSYKSHRIGRALATGLGAPAVLRQHNREGDYHRSLASSSTGLRRVVLRWEAARVAKDEAEVDRATWLRATADISLADAAARRAAGGRNVVFVPPFAFDLSQARRPQTAATDRNGSRVLFLGALDVPTNTAGLDWFLGQVWPQVVARAPHA